MLISSSTKTDSINTSSASVAIDCEGYVLAAVAIYGAWAATLVFEATIDNNNWFLVDAFALPAVGGVVNQTQLPGQWQIQCASFKQLQVRPSNWVSGSAQVTWKVTSSGELNAGRLNYDGSLQTNFPGGTGNFNHAGGNNRLIGHIINRHKVTNVPVYQNDCTTGAGAFIYSKPLYVNEYTEMLLIASLTAAATGSPDGFTMKIQISDTYTGIVSNDFSPSFIDHPDGALAAITPGSAKGPIAIMKYANFGDLIRVGVKWTTAWTTGGMVAVNIKLKS